MRKGKIRLPLLTGLLPGAAFCQETSSGWLKASSLVSQRKKKIKSNLFLGRQWHSGMKESGETTWLGGKRNKVLRVQSALGITPRSLGFTIGSKNEMQIVLPISWAMYQLTCRISHGDTDSKWKFPVIHVHECHTSPSPGFQPKRILELAFVLGLSALEFESVFTWL